jgi:hypothetical protein
MGFLGLNSKIYLGGERKENISRVGFSSEVILTVGLQTFVSKASFQTIYFKKKGEKKKGPRRLVSRLPGWLQVIKRISGWLQIPF